eukprot:3178622-Prymnesium_polylepis.1
MLIRPADLAASHNSAVVCTAVVAVAAARRLAPPPASQTDSSHRSAVGAPTLPPRSYLTPQARRVACRSHPGSALRRRVRPLPVALRGLAASTCAPRRPQTHRSPTSQSKPADARRCRQAPRGARRKQCRLWPCRAARKRAKSGAQCTRRG